MTDTNTSFLPESYEAPAGGGYMKLQAGENKIRVLSNPLLGYIDWKDKKPVRTTMENKPEKSFDSSKPFKHFWVLVVWDYTAGAIEILEITQVTIIREIEMLSRDTDWGHPSKYDIKIKKEGEGMSTKYTVSPVPHAEISQEVKDAYIEKSPINLEALFEGGDPFGSAKEEKPAEVAQEGARPNVEPKAEPKGVEIPQEVTDWTEGKPIPKGWEKGPDGKLQLTKLPFPL